MYIFLDESGDLGFDFDKPRTTRKFVITLLVCRNHEIVLGFTKAVRRTIKNKVRGRTARDKVGQELKGTNTSIKVKKYFFSHAPKSGWRIYTVSLNKLRVHDSLKTKTGRKKLYNFISRFILEKVDFSKAGSTVALIVDRSKAKEDVRDFNAYLENQLEARLPLNVPLHVDHQTSHETPGLQAVDMFCWGIFRKYEKGDREWYQVFERGIRFETEYLSGTGNEKDGP